MFRSEFSPAVLAFLAVLLGSGPAVCDAHAPAAYLASLDQAERAYDAQAWGEAAERFAALVKANPDNGALWLRLARAQTRLGRHLEAAPNYEMAMRLGALDAPRGHYALAQTYARAGKTEQALAALRAALDAGYRYRPDVAGDEAFAGLRKDPRFLALAQPGCPRTNRQAGFSCDLDLLLGEIGRVHNRYRQQVSPRDLAAEARAFRKALPHRSDAEAILGLQAIAARLGDGHSLVYPAGMERGVLHLLPLRLYWFSDGLFVIPGGADPAIVGARVSAIGGVAPEVLFERIRPYASHDNDSELKWVSPGYLRIAELLTLVGVPMRDGGFEVTLETRDGARRTLLVRPAATAPGEADFDISLPPPPATAAPLAFSRTESSYWFQRLPNGIVYVQFNHVRDDPAESLAAFARRLREEIKAAPVRGLILDLRRNNGGEGTLTPDLLRTLVWFEIDHGPRSLVALIGRNTFSAAQNFTSYLNTMTGAVFVGEPTGSRPIHVGDEATFRLPYSGAIGQLAPGLHADALFQDERIWIAPDIPAPLSSQDYFTGRDPGIAAALAVFAAKDQAGRP